MNRVNVNLLAIALVVAGCSEPADRVEITETTTRSETRPVPRINATSEERFQLAIPGGQREPANVAEESTTAGETDPAAQAAVPATTGPSAFTFDTPPGWQQVASSQFRDPNFVIGPNGEIECYVSVLGGSGGGLLINANRWRGQMGRAEFSPEEFAALPRATVLGHEAVIVDFNGDFAGMGAEQAKPGYRLVGALIEAPDRAIFIKMTGPDAAVEAQKDNFALFAQSLRETTPTAAIEQPAQSAGEPPVETETPSTEESADASGFTWTVPAGWTADAQTSPMRLVTFRFGPGGAGECYVSSLPGAAGGRLENFNRWLAQMGSEPLQESELDLQPTLFMFDEEIPMLIATGTYTGMGGESRADHVMVGAIATVGEESIFVKLIAPETVGKDNMRNFQAFCASLKKS